MASFKNSLTLSYLTPSSLSAKPIPAVPTLAELQKHVESLSESVSGALPTLPSYSTAAGPGKPGKVAGVGGKEALRGGAGVGVGAAESGSAGQSWHLLAPPDYCVTDPSEMDDGTPGGVKLKKQRIGWRRLQQGIPGEGAGVRAEGPRMEGSKAYAESVSSGNQAGVHDVQGQHSCRSTLWEWVTCRTCT